MENEKLSYNGSWIYKFIINNHTNKTLKVRNKKLLGGTWYRDNVDDAEPAEISANSSSEVIGIRAARGAAIGYKFRSTWYVEDPIGAIDLHVDVPYLKGNKSSLNVSGNLRVANWSKLPISGHNFVQTVDVYFIGNNRVIDREMGSKYVEYNNLLNYNNETILSWAKLSQLEELEQFDPIEKIPKKLLYPPKEIFICRSKPYTIKRSDWEEINDPIFPFLFQKQKFVDSYFAVAVHSVNTDPHATQSIHAGTETAFEMTVEVNSSISNILENVLSIRSFLKAQAGTHIAAELENNFSVKNVMEESNSKMERTTNKVTIGKSEFERLFVQWLFSTTIAIYRKRKDKNAVELVAASEWASEILNKVYTY